MAFWERILSDGVRAADGAACAAAATPTRSVLMSTAARCILICGYMLFPFLDRNSGLW
jgi:hypothetical protein